MAPPAPQPTPDSAQPQPDPAPDSAQLRPDPAQPARRLPLGDLSEKMGIELVEISAERVVATMPVTGNTQPYGLLHGGASVVLAETLGSMGSAVHAGPDRQAVGVDINATHHRSARDGVVTGVATAVHLGRSSACYEIVVSDEAGRRLCTARLTCALVPTRRP